VLIGDMGGPWTLRQAMVGLEFHTDVTELFSWNTKQAFLWISIDYVNSRNVRNDVRPPPPSPVLPLLSPSTGAHGHGVMQISIWDHIIMAGETKKIDYTLLRSKYKVVDQVYKPAARPSCIYTPCIVGSVPTLPGCSTPGRLKGVESTF